MSDGRDHMTPLTVDEQTKAYYDTRSPSFAAETLYADMSETVGRFAAMVEPGSVVADLGCGSGRDTLALARLGFRVIAMDISDAMISATTQLVERARAAGEKDLSVTVEKRAFSEMGHVGELGGAWACASLLHVPPSELPVALRAIRRALRPDGALYCSFKLAGNGATDMGMSIRREDGRLFCDLGPGMLESLLSVAGFEVAEMWVSSDVRPSRETQRWLNALARPRAEQDGERD